MRPEDDWLECEGPVGIGPNVSDIGSRDASSIHRGTCMIDRGAFARIWPLGEVL